MSPQRPAERLHRLRATAWACALAAVQAAAAQDGAAAFGGGASARTLVSGGVSSALTVSDNVRQTPDGPQSDAVLRVSPWVRGDVRTGRVQGSLDYTLTGVVYARHSESNEIRNSLAARAAAELWQNHLFVESRADVSRSAISAFGTPESGNAVVNANGTEVGRISIAPRLVGRIAGVVDLDARVVRDVARAKDTDAGDSAGTSYVLGLSGGGARLGWGLEANRRTSDYRGGRRTTEDRAFASVVLRPDIDWRLAVRAGRDGDDVLQSQRRWTTTYGATASWQPSPRTSVTADADHRYFGDSHSLVFQHRMARSTWRYGDTRSSSTSTNVRPVTAYDLYFVQFASLVPDPVERDAFVRLFLAAQGIDPGLAVGGGFLTSAVTVQRRRDLSVSYSLQRTSVTLIGFATDTRRLDAVASGLGDDFSRADAVRQSGFVFNVGHRLSPEMSLAAGLSRLHSGGGVGSTGHSTTTLDLNWSARLGPRANVVLGARHAEAEGSAGVTETALTATLNLRF